MYVRVRTVAPSRVTVSVARSYPENVYAVRSPADPSGVRVNASSRSSTSYSYDVVSTAPAISARSVRRFPFPSHV